MSCRNLARAITLLMIHFSLLARANEAELFYQMGKATSLIEKSSFSEALTVLSQGLAIQPDSPVVHYNMGVAFVGLELKEKAQASFQLALKHAGENPSHSELRFRSHFNLGALAGAEKKVDEALVHYQQALAEKPDSLETKINIELLMNQQQQDQKQEQNKDQQQKQKQDQNQQGQGESQKDQKDQKDQQDKKDQKDPQQDQKQDQKEERPEEQKPGQYERPQPKEFQSEDLTKSDVNKILDEIKQQEQKIRLDFQRKETKERPREKSW